MKIILPHSLVKKAHWSHLISPDERKEEKEEEYLFVLEQLEKAFLAYGVSEQEGRSKKPGGCQMRIVCEVYQTNALTVNRGASTVIASAIR